MNTEQTSKNTFMYNYYLEAVIAYDKKYQQINNLVSNVFYYNVFWSRL